MKECKQMNLGRWQDVKIIGLKIYIIIKSFKEDFYCGIAIFVKKGALFSPKTYQTSNIHLSLLSDRVDKT